MNLDRAKALTLPLVGKHNCVIVASDGSVYCDTDIEALKLHAKEHNLKLIPIKLPAGVDLTSDTTDKKKKK